MKDIIRILLELGITAEILPSCIILFIMSLFIATNKQIATILGMIDFLKNSKSMFELKIIV